MKEKLNDGSTKASQYEKLAGMNDQELLDHCKEFIWLSAYAANNPKA